MGERRHLTMDMDIPTIRRVAVDLAPRIITLYPLSLHGLSFYKRLLPPI